MGKLRWYKRDPVAALEGMSNLTLEERGAYNTVLDLIYARDGKVDDDDRFIAGWLRCDVRVWRRIKSKLLELKKIYVVDGSIHNPRADEEVDEGLQRVASVSEASRTKGIKSGAARRKNKDLDEPKHEPTTNTSTTTTRCSEPRGSDAGASLKPAEPIFTDSKHELWGEGPAILATLGVPERGARGNIGRWMKAAKDDAGAVLSAIKRARDQRVQDPIPWITRAISTGPPGQSVPRDFASLMAQQLTEKPDEPSYHAGFELDLTANR
jgi:uncharacterized protein YdaU (DUF1376 family)